MPSICQEVRIKLTFCLSLSSCINWSNQGSTVQSQWCNCKDYNTLESVWEINLINLRLIHKPLSNLFYKYSLGHKSFWQMIRMINSDLPFLSPWRSPLNERQLHPPSMPPWSSEFLWPPCHATEYPWTHPCLLWVSFVWYKPLSAKKILTEEILHVSHKYLSSLRSSATDTKHRHSDPADLNTLAVLQFAIRVIVRL